MQKNDSILPLRISVVAIIVLLLLVFTSAQQPLGFLPQQEEEVLAQQQQSAQETGQKIPLGTASDSIFTNYLNPQYGFGLLYLPNGLKRK